MSETKAEVMLVKEYVHAFDGFCETFSVLQGRNVLHVTLTPS
jgi:hypothetical protein